jgi:phosphocarrier protein HPr
MSAKTATDGKISKTLVVQNKLGIHARPAALFAKTANRFKSDVFVEKDGETINAKSIMGLMMLAAGPGSKILVIAKGPDASDAVKAIEDLLESKFGED